MRAALCLLPFLAAPAFADEPLTLPFAAEIGGQPLACGTDYAGLGTAGTGATPTDFRFFVSDVALIDAAGTEHPAELTEDGIWQSRGIALLDFEDGSGACSNGTPQTNTALKLTAPEAPEGGWQGVSFTVGLPPELNHADPVMAPSPLNLTSMFWSWQTGYTFLRLDLKTDAGPWFLHLGATMCAGDSPTSPPDAACRNPNAPRVVLKGPLDGATVVAAAGALVGAVDLSERPEKGMAGCMSMPGSAACAAAFPVMGLPYDDTPAAPQRLFSLR